ncbi:MAG: cytidylate kinase [Acidithiobacillus ferrivorans]|uniref:(d)CMP kinase n=1 Tax=Acidithiobacillus ferrivorans TaxID=160808 RepID=A0A257T9H0_9PROT|nr:MAG: cytidylate kinase [Acidithiobacillus ferrivorans]
MSGIPVITLDGPGGVGKGTLSRLLARDLGWHLLDSGAIYRTLALAAQRAGLSADKAVALSELARTLPLSFRGGADETHVLLAGELVDAEIRSPEISALTSQIAAIPAVRAALLQRQRDFRQAPGLVADGRGRLNQLMEQGSSANLATVVAEIAERDARDQQRSVAPLRPASDARLLDTSEQSVSDTYRVLQNWVQSALQEN